MALKIVKGTFSIFSYVGDVQGCGTIRVIWPHFLLNHTRMKGVKFSAFFAPYFVHHPEFYTNYGICQFQRSATEDHLHIFKHFLKVIKPQAKCGLTYESDDLLVDIPEWNYAHDYYKKYFPYIQQMMQMADGITVSTLRLKEIYKKYNENIVVIPNHLPKHVWGPIWEKHHNEPRERRPRILWAGSQNHFVRKMDKVHRGLEGGDFGDKLLSFIRKTTDKYKWVFVGAMPVELESVKNKIEFHQWQPVFEYPQYVKNLDVDFGIAPLEDNVFNACKCLVGHTKVVTDNGIKEISKVMKGEYIWQENGWEIISSTIKYEKQPTLRIITERGYELEGTYNHRVRSNGDFIKLSELNINDEVDLGFFSFFEIPIYNYQKISVPFFLTKKLDDIDLNLTNDNVLPYIEINERWGGFLGYVLGNGHLARSNAVAISCDKRYEDVIEDIKLFANEIGVSTTDVEKEGKYGLDVRFNSRNLMWFLKEKIGFEGRNGKILRVPEVIWNSPQRVIKEFLKKLFEVDGTVDEKHSCCSITSKNYLLIQDIQFLLLGFGILTKIYPRIYPRWSKRYKRFYYDLYLGRQASDLFYERIGFFSEKKTERLRKIYEKKHSNKYEEWQLKDKIVSIEKSIQDVYDIEVPKRRYYFANGIISHNSNIKMLEYTACGIPGIYSNVEPYWKAHLLANDEEEMISHIEALGDSIDLREKTYNKDYQTVRGQLWWEESGNLKQYANSYLKLFGRRLP